MTDLSTLYFVDVEAAGPSPISGKMTELGIVHYTTRATFYSRFYPTTAHPDNPAVPVLAGGPLVDLEEELARLCGWLAAVSGGRRKTMVSDNPAYDAMWVACAFDQVRMPNPFGHSARRLGDFWAGMNLKWGDASSWKRLRRTRHDHNPVNDAMGNVEAFEAMLAQIPAAVRTSALTR